jgi:hypothetical protein
MIPVRTDPGASGRWRVWNGWALLRISGDRTPGVPSR